MVRNLARLIAIFLADPHLAAQSTDTLHRLVSASSRLLCDARRIRDGAFPAKGPNQPDDYYRMMATSIYPSGSVMSVDEYQKLQSEMAERTSVATGSRPPTTAPSKKRDASATGVDAATSPSKRPQVVASVRPPTPYPHGEESATTPRGQAPDTGSTIPAATNTPPRHEKIILSLNGCRRATCLEPFSNCHLPSQRSMLVTLQQLLVAHVQTIRE